MLSSDKIIEVFFFIDEFYKDFHEVIKGHVLPIDSSKKRRNKPCRLSDSEVITILVLFHLGQFRNLKHFYIFYVQQHLKADFPQTVSYNRFVELQQKAAMPLAIFLKTCCLGRCTGVSFVDSTPLKACHIKRERSNKVLRAMATKGKSTIGWFFGMKLHLIINDKGEILDFMLTQAHIDDREPLKQKSFHEKIFGKLFGDKGYISQSLFEQLFIDGIHLVTRLRKNMKNSLMHIHDRLLLKKRAIIESVNDELKNICQIEHTRHRSVENFLTNLLSGLIAYHFLPKKPSINLEIIDNKALTI
jgi:Transposase DDE domain